MVVALQVLQLRKLGEKNASGKHLKLEVHESVSIFIYLVDTLTNKFFKED